MVVDLLISSDSKQSQSRHESLDGTSQLTGHVLGFGLVALIGGIKDVEQ